MIYMFNLEDYETVEERLVKFWKDHPDGQIHTRLLESTASRFIVEASIFRTEADPRPWTTGLAEETVQGRGVNATSALENCETSAIGRALANAGYATKGKRASREEMSKVAAKSAADNAIAQAKAKMAQTATEYVPIAKEDDPWTVREAAPAATVDEAVNMVKDIIGGQTERDIPNCTKCEEPKPMRWGTGVSLKTKKPWGKFDCYVCKDVKWYEINKETGAWQPQEKKW
jgi:hypothetical protein